MPNKENVKPYEYKKGQISSEVAAMNGRKGGLAKAKAEKERQNWREEITRKLGAKDFDEIIDNLIARAKDSDKAFEVLRDTMGQKPVTETLITTDADDFEFKFKYSK